MSTFLLGLLGVVVGLLLVGVVAWFWIKRKVGQFVKGLGELAGAGAVSPFRITLEPSSHPEWAHVGAVESVTSTLEGLGYARAGDFLVPEMDGVKLRGMVNDEACTLAALYEHPQVDHPLLDLVRLHRDLHHALVSTAPATGMDAPPRKIVRRVEHELTDDATLGGAVAAMHQELLAASADRVPVPIAVKLFELTFTTAYAAEMDWRIERGGVTADEVRGAATAGGLDPPDEDDIERVQRQWRGAISYFVGEEAQRAFLAAGTVSAADWEDMRDRILVVHEHTELADLVDSLAAELLEAQASDDGDANDEEEEEGDRFAVIERQVRVAFGTASPMEGFEAARQTVAALAAYEHLGDVEKPWRAKIYRVPESV